MDDRKPNGPIQKVQLVDLNLVLEREGIEKLSYLKLDCEGAEFEVIRSLTEETAKRIDQVTMEVHRIEGCDRQEIFQILRSFGFEFRQGNPVYCYKPHLTFPR